MFSYEIYKISKNNFFYRTATVVASEVYSCFQRSPRQKPIGLSPCIPNLAEKGICCCKNPEAATPDALWKKAYSFVKKGSSIAKFLRTPI